jgi:hypothetical protein
MTTNAYYRWPPFTWRQPPHRSRPTPRPVVPDDKCRGDTVGIRLASLRGSREEANHA